MNKKHYRPESFRKPKWNYDDNGFYFLTLNTANRECNLSQIVKTNGNAEVKLLPFGEIVQSEWLRSFQMKKELFCPVYVIMPNHIHAIVQLSMGEKIKPGIDVAEGITNYGNPTMTIDGEPIIRKSKSISSFVGGFKSAVNSRIDDYIDLKKLSIPKYNRNNHFFQPNYHDRIIRNQNEYDRIRAYILDNPKNWDG